MRIDLQTARVRPVGSGGIAHRTNAGFVMLGTADSRNVLTIVEQNAANADLIELVIGELAVAAPKAFCLLFVSQDELFVLTCGSAVVALTTATTQTVIEPQPQQVLIQRLDLGVGDTDGRLVLFQKGMTVDQVDGLDSVVDLQSGTVLADALDLTVRRVADVSGTTTAVVEQAASIPIAAAIPAAAPVPVVAVAPSAPVAPSIAAAPAPIPVPVPEFDLDVPTQRAIVPDQPVPSLQTPVGIPPTMAPAKPPTAPTPPSAADQILFAEDIAEERTEPVSPASPAAPTNGESVISLVAEDQAPAIAVPSVPPSLQPSAASAASAGAFSGVLSQSTQAPAARSQADIVAVTPPPAPASAGPVMVLGVACPDGHHNHPDATTCSECAARIGEHHTTVLMNGPRPALGLLMVDDGKTWSLSSDIIIGREPASHADIANGTAVSMALTDDTLSLSRQHARVTLDDWSAYVIDLGSSNGTYLNRNRGAQEWSQVPSDMALPLEPGDRLRVGGRIIQVELTTFEG